MRFLRTGMCIATCLGVYAIYGEQISSAVETMDRQGQLGSRILPSLAKKPLQTPKETITRSKVLEGTAVVIDGNTIEIASQKVGLLKYRACSPGQMAKTASGDMDCGLWAKESLEGFTDNRTLRCIIHLRDHAKAGALQVAGPGRANAFDLLIINVFQRL